MILSHARQPAGSAFMMFCTAEFECDKLGDLLADQARWFLDEVGDIPIEIRPKLLRACRNVNLSGWTAPTLEVDVRIVDQVSRSPSTFLTPFTAPDYLPAKVSDFTNVL